jgi:alpha-aminoadipic semialdehyde synthase
MPWAICWVNGRNYLIKTIGILRETKNEWERRVPLIPEDLKHLISGFPLKVIVQPSERRIFPDDEFRAAGAIVQEDLSPCDLILGIKEVKIVDLIPEKTYIYFSHTIKGQSYNMPMLQRLLDLKCTLIDYERMRDENKQRVIYFSYHAGVAGMIDTFWTFARRLHWERIDSPFGLLKQTFQYTDQTEAVLDFKKIADQIRSQGLPEKITPLVIGITGYGNVSKGAQDMLDHLPLVEIHPKELRNIRNTYKDHSKTIYKVVFKEEDMAAPLSMNTSFDLQEYYNHPDRYKADFDKYLPFLSMLINASFWDNPYPRHVTKQAMGKLYSGTGIPALRVIGDISCDVEGGIECTLKVTDPGNPVFVYEPENGIIHDGVSGKGPVIMAVDNLPSELPKDASIHFSSILRELMPAFMKVDLEAGCNSPDLPYFLKKAIIIHKGRLTDSFQYLEKYL